MGRRPSGSWNTMNEDVVAEAPGLQGWSAAKRQHSRPAGWCHPADVWRLADTSTTEEKKPHPDLRARSLTGCAGGGIVLGGVVLLMENRVLANLRCFLQPAVPSPTSPVLYISWQESVRQVKTACCTVESAAGELPILLQRTMWTRSAAGTKRKSRSL